MNMIQHWVHKTLSNHQVVGLCLVLTAIVLLLTFFGQTLTPILAAMVIAYLLEGGVKRLEGWNLPRKVSAVIVWLGFAALLALGLFILVPLVTRQIAQLAQDAPTLIANIKTAVQTLPEKYPQMVSENEVALWVKELEAGFTDFRNAVLARSWVVGVGVLYFAVYLILVPMLVLFMLKDKATIQAWIRGLLPTDLSLIRQVWEDVDRQTGNYVRGKALEIFLVGVLTWLTFALLELNYPLLLGVLTGLSVLIPYLGALAVTLPVAAVALAQWGLGTEFGWVLFCYGVIQAVDGNVLVPILFSEAVDLHPVAIIMAVLVFGSVWGFWGVFFAIPLATVVSAILRAWPGADDISSGHSAEV